MAAFVGDLDAAQSGSLGPFADGPTRWGFLHGIVSSRFECVCTHLSHVFFLQFFSFVMASPALAGTRRVGATHRQQIYSIISGDDRKFDPGCLLSIACTTVAASKPGRRNCGTYR
jgi:hypothetical protein